MIKLDYIYHPLSKHDRTREIGGGNLLKKVLSVCIIFLLFSSTANMGVNAKETFNDLGTVPWAKEAIYFLNDQGVINGYGKGKFGPNDKITREQAALMLVRELYPEETSSTALPFADVK